MADLIRMSEATALGLHTMAVIARYGKPMSTTQIATELRASEAHLSKVLRQLVRVGLLSSKRGPGGGYALAKPSDETSLLDVYEVLEGPLRRDGCLFSEPVCGEVNCILGDLVERLRRKAHDHLESTSLSDIANERRR
jgi:Rrf2 family nitric oxide-sensitive transcriptional repressor